MRDVRLIDANALFEVASRHHDFFRGATSPTDKARRDEYLQVMCDINDAPTVDAVPVDWIDDRANDITRAPLFRRYAQQLLDEWEQEEE